MAPPANILRNIAADSSLALILVGISAPLWYLTTLVMARFYGAQEMGTYFIAWNMILVLSAICRLGLDVGLLRFGAVLKTESRFQELKRLFWPAIGVVTGLSIVASLVVSGFRDWLALRFNAPYLPIMLLFLAPALPFFTLTFCFRETLRALGGIKAAVFQKNILLHLAFIILLLLLAYHGSRILGKYGAIGLACLISLALNLAFLAVCLHGWTRQESLNFGEKSFKDLFVYSLPLFLNAILTLTFTAVDRLILGVFTSPQEVAYYEVAARAETIITLPLMAVNNVIPPLFAEFYELGNVKSLEIIAQTTARWAYCIGLPLTLLLILLATDFLAFFGPDFIKGRFALIVLSLAQLVNVSCGSVAFLLTMTGHQWTVTISWIVTGCGALLLMVALAATHGLNGLAVASALGIAGINIVLALAVWRFLNLKSFARGIRWANLSALLCVLLFLVSKPLVGPFPAAGIFLLGYSLAAIRPLKREILEIIRFGEDRQ